MKELLEAFDSLDPALQLAAKIAGVVLALVVVDVAQRAAMRRFRRRAARTAVIWDEAVAYGLTGPLSTLIWFSGLLGSLDLLSEEVRWRWLARVGDLWVLLFTATLAWFLLRLTRGVEEGMVRVRERRGEPVDPTTFDAIGKLVRIVIIVVASLAVLQTLGVGIAGLLAAGGVGGVAIGFAAKDLLANFFGGLTVYLDRPFAVGDWIRTLDGQIEGNVERIGWRSTVIRTFEKRPIYVPNALFTTIAVENPSRMTHRRIREWVGIRYDDIARVGAICAALRAALAGDADVDAAQGVFVNLDRYGPSSVDLLIVCYTPRHDFAEFQQVKERALLLAAQVIAAHGAEIAFPTQVLKFQGAMPPGMPR
jgi:MscS family membrane protein